MNESIASAITKEASKQTYFTIRLLADRARVEDAYRAYAYFRWVDDVLDAAAESGSGAGDSGPAGRESFLARQKYLLESCLRGEAPRDLTIEELLLVELAEGVGRKDAGLRAYLHNMMHVMDFDVRRRGRLVSRVELDRYTHWLAIAVTEAMHYFIGNGEFAPRDETRYLAVSGAHIAHMLRDAHEDARAGYFNVPREVLEAGKIGPLDVDSEAYRAWVKSRVALARGYFEAGRTYLARVQNTRCRVAGLAYMARFEWLLGTIESEGFRLRPQYREKRSIRTGLRMGWLALSGLVRLPVAEPPSRPASSQRRGVA